jgi:hypothetical protein
MRPALLDGHTAQPLGPDVALGCHRLDTFRHRQPTQHRLCVLMLLGGVDGEQQLTRIICNKFITLNLN